MNATEISRLPKLKTTLVTLLAFIAFNASGQTVAQTEDETEVIEPIVVKDHYASEDDIATEDEFDDLALDEETGNYRLIEDDAEDDWVEPPSQTEQDSEELRRLFELYREALLNEDFLEADVLAKRVVELSIRINGLDSHDSAKAITNLGIAQHHNKDYESALLNFAASIEIVERVDDRLSAALINPLQGLAATQAAVGRPDEARSTYQRAVHVSHVNDGPHNPNQVETLESMAELYLAMGEFKDATGIQENIFSIQSRKIDPRSLDIIPALEKRAAWQHRLNHFQGERSSWRLIIQVLERHKGKESLDLIPPLKKLGTSYLFVSPAEFEYQPDTSASSGETHLRRANRIAHSNPDSNWMITEDALLALGDFYVLSGRPNRANRIYAESWELLTEGEDQERLNNRRDHLEKQLVLQKVYPPKYYNSLREEARQPPPASFETGTISFSYTVLASGRISQLEHVETQPAGIKKFDELVARSLRRLIYRPRLVESKMVDTPDVIYTHNFFYQPSDLDNPDDNDANSDDADKGGSDKDEQTDAVNEQAAEAEEN